MFFSMCQMPAFQQKKLTNVPVVLFPLRNVLGVVNLFVFTASMTCTILQNAVYFLEMFNILYNR